jgi:hypothetical protein
LLKQVDREPVPPSPSFVPLPASRQYATGAISAVGGSYEGPTYVHDSSYTLREETVHKLLELVMAQTVVQVRGTPTCGKTVLANLLYSYAQKAYPDYVVVYVTWQLYGSYMRQKQRWKEFLCTWSRGHIQPENFWTNNNVIYIIDEAQLSYEDELFWVECIKTQKDKLVGPYFVLFSLYGSALSIVLEIKGSAPVDLIKEQRVPLTPQPGWPHDITLCFTVEELRNMCQRMIGQRGFTVDADVLEHLFILTNGHPGLARGLLVSLLDREVSGLNARVIQALILVIWPGRPPCDSGRRTSDAQTCIQAIR